MEGAGEGVEPHLRDLGEEGEAALAHQEHLGVQVGMDLQDSPLKKGSPTYQNHHSLNCVYDFVDPVPVLDEGMLGRREVGSPGEETEVVAEGVGWWRPWTRSPQGQWRGSGGVGTPSCHELPAEGTEEN